MLDQSLTLSESVTYTLPGAGAVTVPLNPMLWPRKDRQSGFVPIDMIVPDPEQPRSYFDPAGLDDLAESMKERGQVEIATICIMFPDEAEAQAPLADGRVPIYMLVSGERRWRAAQKAGLPIFEVRIMEFANKAERFLFAFLFNESRESLPAIDTARNYNRILRDNCGGNISELVRKIAKSRTHVELYLKLNLLPLEVLAFMDPHLPVDKQLRLGTAQRLADDDIAPKLKIRFAKEIVEGGHGGATAVSQKQWIEEVLLRERGHGAHFNSEVSRDPSKERLMVMRFVNSFRSRIEGVMSVSATEHKKALDTFSVEDLDLCLERLTSSLESGKALLRRIESARANRRSLSERLAQNATLAESGFRLVRYYEGGLVQTKTISRTKQAELREKGMLDWQVEGKPEPEVEQQKEEQASGPVSDNKTVKVSYYEKGRGTAQQLVQGALVDPQKYTELRLAKKLFWQRSNLSPSDSEAAFCTANNLTF